MQPDTAMPATIPLPVLDIDNDVPIAMVPTASVAPLDGPPDGERINVFALAPRKDELDRPGVALADLRHRVLGQPLTYVAIAFSLGFVLARLVR